MKPVRVQLRRTKGWRMPPNTVSVARPGRWGNPHWVNRWRDLATCIALFRNTVQGCWSPSAAKDLPDAWAEASYEDHHRWLKRLGGHPLELVGPELSGKNLACWCKIGTPCHADVLLELANPSDHSAPDRASMPDMVSSTEAINPSVSQGAMSGDGSPAVPPEGQQSGGGGAS